MYWELDSCKDIPALVFTSYSSSCKPCIHVFKSDEVEQSKTFSVGSSWANNLFAATCPDKYAPWAVE